MKRYRDRTVVGQRVGKSSVVPQIGYSLPNLLHKKMTYEEQHLLVCQLHESVDIDKTKGTWINAG